MIQLFAGTQRVQVEGENEYWANFSQLDALPVACCACDASGAIRFSNQQAQTLWSYSAQPDTDIGCDLCKLYTTDGQEITYPQNPVLQAVAENAPVQIEAILERPDGSRTPLSIHAKPLYNKDSDPAGALVTFIDTSGQQQIARELNSLRALNKNLLLHTHLGIIVSNKAGDIQSVNAFAETLSGFTADELVGTHITELFRNPVNHLDVLKKMAAELPIPFTNPAHVVQEYIRQKGFIYRENRVLTKTGQLIRVQSSVSGLYDEHDEFIGFVNKFSDISAQKETEATLAHTSNRLQIATEVASVGVWEFDYTTGQRFWDDRIYEMYGIDPAVPPLSPDEFLALIHPDDRDDIKGKLADLVRTGTLQAVLRMYRVDTGELAYINTQGRLLTGPDGKPERFIAIAQDVTQSHLVTLAKQESDDRFRHLAELVDDLFWIRSTTEPRFLYANPTYERLFGLSREDLYTNPYAFFDKVVPEDLDVVKSVLLNLNPASTYYNFRIFDPEGKVRWLTACSILVRDEQGQVISRFGVARDITLQKERETMLQQALTLEQELSQQKSDFITTASHEFRTPLTAIQSSVDIIKFYLKSLEDTMPMPVRLHIDKIEDKILHIGGLLSDILTLSRIEARKLPYTPQKVDLPALCHQILTNDFANLIGGQSLLFQVEGTPRDILLDVKLMRQVIENLVSNALKFSANAVFVRLCFGETEVRLLVIDQGIGIPSQSLPHLFERFYRAPNAGTIQGTGLGLSIVKQFVELQDGRLQVDSQEGKGSCFSVIFSQ